MKRVLKLLFIVVLTSCFSVVNAQNKLGLQIEHLSQQKMVFDVAVSPDAQLVAYMLIVPRPISDGVGGAYRQLFVYDVKTKEHRHISSLTSAFFNLSWSPDGKVLGFLMHSGTSSGVQLHGIERNASEVKQLSSFERSIRKFQWLDNQNIVFFANSLPTPEKQKMIENKFDLKIFEEELLDVDLWRFNLNTTLADQLTSKVTVHDFVVSKDGKKIAAAISDINTVDASYMFKKIHVLDAKNGKLIEKIENPGKLSAMRFSPDGKYLAFQASSKVEDAVDGSLFVIELDQNKKYSDAINIVEGMELSVVALEWESNSTLLYASEESVDNTIRRYDFGNKVKVQNQVILTGGQVCFSNFSVVGNNIYLAANTWQHPNELFHYDIKKSQISKLSNHNSFLEKVKLAKQEKISYIARDGMRVDGVLIYPLNYTEGNSYPMIVYIHGGPEASVQNGWISNYSQWGQFAAARDYFVFFPNYRASSSRGVDYTMQGFADLLGKEYDDVIDGVDHLIEKGLVDKNMVGIGGGSYGGFFAAWSSTKHSERFAASVVFVGISNQISKRYTTDIPWEDYLVHWGFWTTEDYERVWNVSPVKYAHKSKTPTLILHGEEDPRIPVSQGLELYRALKMHGKAPVRFVIYPREGHGNALNINRLDYLQRTLDWFDFYIKEGNNTDMPAKYLEYTN